MICLKSFPSQVQLLSGPGRRYPAKLRTSSPSGPRARPQSPQSARGWGWGGLVHVQAPGWREDGEPGDRHEPTLAPARPLCSELSPPWVPQNTTSARAPCPLPCPPSSQPWHSTPTRLIQSRAPDGRHLNHHLKSGKFTAPRGVGRSM